MPISEGQLNRWAQIPSSSEMSRIQNTHNAVREALKAKLPTTEIRARHNLAEYNYDVYLQGSYANDTYIRLNSDVDVVVELNSTWGYDVSQLSQREQAAFQAAYSTSQYTFQQYKQDIFQALQKYFGTNQVAWSRKCIKIKESDSRVPADVVPAFQHRKYKWFYHALPDGHAFVEGIKFWNTDDNTVIINYPKLHKENLTLKHQVTGQRFKPMVRIFKNMRMKLIESNQLDGKTAPSYYLENLLYNTTDSCYQGTYTDMTIRTLQQLYDDLKSGRISGYKCANEQESLMSDTAWNVLEAGQFIVAVGKYFLNG